MFDLLRVLIGDWHQIAPVAVRAAALFAAASLLVTGPRRLTESPPDHWVAAARSAPWSDRARRQLTAPGGPGRWRERRSCRLTRPVSRLRRWPVFRRFIDPPALLLVRDGVVDRRHLRRGGMTEADLAAALRQQGSASPAQAPVKVVLSEARGAVSVLSGAGSGRQGAR